MDFDNTVTIHRSREDVFAYLAEFENLPSWNYALSSTRRTDSGPVGVGAQYTQTREIPRHAVETFEVIRFEPVDSLAIRGTFGPFRAESSYVLEDADGATVLTNAMQLEPDGPLRLVAGLAGSGVRKAVAANLGALKDLLERPRSTDEVPGKTSRGPRSWCRTEQG
jgi:uncharacterized protein YndB with AHSA1/START domain